MKQAVKSFSLLLVATTLFSCTQEKEKTQSSAVSVKTVQASYFSTQTNNEFPFISKPYRSSELSFRVSGPVNVMDIHSGKHYRKGELIAAIDARDYQVKLDRSKALYEQSEAEYKRIEALYKLNNISASAYDKAKADYHAALAALNNAQNELNDTKLIAPFDGYVQDVLFERYQDIKPMQPICSFIDINQLKIEAFVPQQVAMRVNKEENIQIKFDALSQESFTASIEQISKGVSKNNLSFIVTAILPNPTAKLPSGMSGTIVINEEKAAEEMVVVPQNTIRKNTTAGTCVWTIADGKAKCIPIVTGKLLKGGMIEITEGVKAGDQVITTSLELLSEGLKINQVN